MKKAVRRRSMMGAAQDTDPPVDPPQGYDPTGPKASPIPTGQPNFCPLPAPVSAAGPGFPTRNPNSRDPLPLGKNPVSYLIEERRELIGRLQYIDTQLQRYGYST